MNREVEVVEGADEAGIRARIRQATAPFVVRGLVAQWPAVQRAREGVASLAAYLQGLDNGRPAGVLTASAHLKGRFGYTPDLEALNFSRSQQTLSEVVATLIRLSCHPMPPGLYLQSAPARDHAPEFSAQNPMPLLPPEIGPRLWVGNATRAALHNDHDLNLACLVAGRRHFLLFPPEQVGNLYIGPLGYTPSGRPISIADLDTPDFETFPRLRDAFEHAQNVTLEPGDVLFIPRYWWHQVTTEGPFGMLANFWWGSYANPLEDPAVLFNQALAVMAGLSEADRAYWREMFRLHIADPRPAHFEHLPPDARQMTEVERRSLLSGIEGFMRRHFGA